jgi:hypothetical protein
MRYVKPPFHIKHTWIGELVLIGSFIGGLIYSLVAGNYEMLVYLLIVGAVLSYAAYQGSKMP